MSMLIDNNVNLLITDELKKSEKIMKIYNSIILNAGLLLIFVITIGSILYIKYKDKNNKDRRVEEEKRSNLLEKVANMQYINKNQTKKVNNLITDLPIFSNIL